MATKSSKKSKTRDAKEVRFGLKTGTRIGNYALSKRIGSGWTAEAYLAHEVPTQAIRVVKLYESFDDGQHVQRMRDFEHYCWVLESLAKFELLPRYHHMGHCFLREADGLGTYYLVQEYLDGSQFKLGRCTTEMIDRFLGKVSAVHEAGFALGDMSESNMKISTGDIRLVDCDYGSHDKPNTRITADRRKLTELFGRS